MESINHLGPCHIRRLMRHKRSGSNASTIVLRLLNTFPHRKSGNIRHSPVLALLVAKIQADTIQASPTTSCRLIPADHGCQKYSCWLSYWTGASSEELCICFLGLLHCAAEQSSRFARHIPALAVGDAWIPDTDVRRLIYNGNKQLPTVCPAVADNIIDLLDNASFHNQIRHCLPPDLF